MSKQILFLFLLISLFISSCKKEANVIGNNTPPNYAYVPTVTIENYINRLYLDLLGREPLPAEMAPDLKLLKDSVLSVGARKIIINRLQNDETFIAGDSSYSIAYYNRYYSMLKARMLESVEDDFIHEKIGEIQGALAGAIASGDSAEAGKIRMQITQMEELLAVRYDCRNEHIGIDSIYIRLINNNIYDQINMNTFNFINACFDNMYYRFPTTEEYTTSFNMIEYNQSGALLGRSGASRNDYLHIVTSSDEFYQGIVQWVFKSLLARNPTSVEVSRLLPIVRDLHSYKQLQMEVMITDEYANFK